MKAAALILLFALCYVECRKVYPPINKNANVDFINMETGGARQPAVVPPPKPASPVTPAPTTRAPVPAPAPKPAVPPTPITAPVFKPDTVQPQRPGQSPQSPTQNKPLNPPPVASPVTTPGPGSVKSLINFYDSQGKGSQIRPYSYSQAVKQG